MLGQFQGISILIGTATCYELVCICSRQPSSHNLRGHHYYIIICIKITIFSYPFSSAYPIASPRHQSTLSGDYHTNSSSCNTDTRTRLTTQMVSRKWLKQAQYLHHHRECIMVLHLQEYNTNNPKTIRRRKRGASGLRVVYVWVHYLVRWDDCGEQCWL